jgi:hypothetical protein
MFSIHFPLLLCLADAVAVGVEWIRTGKMSRNINENVVKKLNIAIKNYERVAYVQFFLAAFVHIPYIVVLAAVTGPFAYNP